MRFRQSLLAAMRGLGHGLTACALWQIPAAALADNQQLPDMEVIGVTPIHGVGLAKDKIPTDVQSASAAQIERSQSLDLTAFMKRTMGSVTLNDAQDNPLQPDLQYRGFTASPLLGLPQGISVYLDGVRVNESFGDTVNWDLLPESMISTINLMGGANPVFGLNSLGGSISIQSKNGFTNPGHSIEAYGGSFGRVVTSAESGANNGTLGYYVNVRYFDEAGWRDASPSEATNVFSTLSWRRGTDSLDLHVSHGNSSLVGNGTQAVSQLAIDRASIFTSPDQTKNDATMVSLEGTHWFSDKVESSGTLYYRTIDTSTYNGDSSDFEDNGSGFLIDDDGNLVIDQNGNPIPDGFDAVNHLSNRNQDMYGGSLQATWLQSLFGRENQFIAGIGYDYGRTAYNAATEVAHLLADRSTDSSGLFVPDAATGVDATNGTASVYFMDAFSITTDVTLTASGRYNHNRTTLNDSLGNAPALNGEHSYSRFNPAVGLTWQVRPTVNLFAGYSEAARAPTPVELACADPNAPCNLPNAFLSDPPLKQVVAKSVEGGVRGRVLGSVNYTLDFFRTTNVDDIIFQTSGGATGTQGFFANVGDTRRQGMELLLHGSYRQIGWFFNYSYVDATFQTTFMESSPNHPDAGANGNILVSAGNTIPGIPKHNLKAGLDYALSDRFSVGADMLVNSGQYLRGDEANLLGTTGAYAVVNVHGRFVINKHLTAFASIDNLFDTRYQTFGVLGQPSDVFPGITDPRMLSPGAPIGGWVGLKVSL